MYVTYICGYQNGGEKRTKYRKEEQRYCVGGETRDTQHKNSMFFGEWKEK